MEPSGAFFARSYDLSRPERQAGVASGGPSGNQLSVGGVESVLEASVAAFFSAVFSAFFTARFSPTSERAEAIAFVTIARHLLHLDDQRIDPAKNVDPKSLQYQHDNANTHEPDRGAQEAPQPRCGRVNLKGNCALTWGSSQALRRSFQSPRRHHRRLPAIRGDTTVIPVRPREKPH